MERPRGMFIKMSEHTTLHKKGNNSYIQFKDIQTRQNSMR